MNQVALGPRPQYLATAANRLNLNDAASQNLTSGFAVVKYRGKVWTVRYRGEENTVTEEMVNAQGQTVTRDATELNVVIVGMSPHMSKTWYETGFQPGTTGKFPDCFSVQGAVPDAASPKKQAPACPTCPQNQFGSRITGNNRKGKACSDHRRIAVVPAADVENKEFGGPMLLQVPAMSLRNLEAHTKELKRLGTDVSEVVTKIYFTSSTYPELAFTHNGWLPDLATFEMIAEMNASPEVQRMLFEEAVEAEGDTGSMSDYAKTLGARPQHLQPVPSPAQQAAPTQPPAPAPVAQPPAPSPAPVAPKRSPFGQKAAIAAVPTQTAPTVAPAPAPAQPAPAPQAQAQAQPAQPAQPQPHVVQGAPPDLEQAIDDLLQ